MILLQNALALCITFIPDGQSLTTTVKTPEVCVDLNHAFCSSTSVHDTICSDPDLSVNWCRKTCGKCRMCSFLLYTLFISCFIRQTDNCNQTNLKLKMLLHEACNFSHVHVISLKLTSVIKKFKTNCQSSRIPE